MPGVECDVDEFGEGVVRVREGVLARVREGGRRKDMFRNLSNGDAWIILYFMSYISLSGSAHLWFRTQADGVVVNFLRSRLAIGYRRTRAAH